MTFHEVFSKTDRAGLMKKVFNILKLTALMIALSLLLIGASTFLRSTFINSVKIWQKNLTDNNLVSVSDDTDATTIPAPQYDISYFCSMLPEDLPLYDFCNSTPSSYLATSFNLQKTHASTTSTDARYQRVVTDTPLLKTSNDADTSVSNTLFLLPKSYFVKILRNVTLDSGAEGYYVRYNTYEGYAVKSAFTGTMSDNTTSQSGIEIDLQEDAGTYLRETPEITSTNTKILIPASTSGLVLIGKIYGDIPSDGSTDLWYFVEYSTGPTTTYTGYVYSERCKLSAPLTDLVLDSDIPKEESATTQTPQLQDTSANASPTANQNLNTTPTLMWIVAIVFIIPIIIVFIMLIKRPRKTLDNYDLIANSDANTDSFDFSEEHSPSIIKRSHTLKFPKFRANKLDELSRFIKLDTSLETADALNPADRTASIPEISENNFLSAPTPQLLDQNSIDSTHPARNFRLKRSSKPVTFARNIRISTNSNRNSTKASIFPRDFDENQPKRLENANDYPNSTNFTQSSTNLNHFSTENAKKPTNYSQISTDLTQKSTKTANLDNFSDQNKSSSAILDPLSDQNRRMQTKKTNNQPVFDSFTPTSDSFDTFSDQFDPISDQNRRTQTKKTNNQPVFDSFTPTSDTFDTFSDQFDPLSDDFSPKPTESHKKSTNFFKNILNRRERKQKITNNRKRDTFHPSILSSDDYFEFADSFELTTPMNSHLGFNTPTRPQTTRSGKQINRRK